jgi:hypothetical protein
VAQDRGQCRALVNTLMNLRGWQTPSFSRNITLYGVRSVTNNFNVTIFRGLPSIWKIQRYILRRNWLGLRSFTDKTCENIQCHFILWVCGKKKENTKHTPGTLFH